jgi:hypothetical protein
MSANQEQVRVRIAAAESVDLRPGLLQILGKAASAVINFLRAQLISGDDDGTWARLERVTWYEGMKHEPAVPEWYRGTRQW